MIEKAQAMTEMMAPYESTVIPKFVVFLAKKGRLQGFPKIMEYLIASLYKSQKIVPVKVTSAFELSDDHKDKLIQKMKKRTGATDIKLHAVTDANIVSGLKVEWEFPDPEVSEK